MRHVPLRARSGGPYVVAGSVTTLELFFDLVFVFTITQLTATLGHDQGWGGVGRTVLLLCLMWWMYGGYAWLTNAAPPVTPFRRGCLLLGMVGNFMMALAIPHASYGWWEGCCWSSPSCSAPRSPGWCSWSCCWPGSLVILLVEPAPYANPAER